MAKETALLSFLGLLAADSEGLPLAPCAVRVSSSDSRPLGNSIGVEESLITKEKNMVE